jgi:hypothetical protein
MSILAHNEPDATPGTRGLEIELAGLPHDALLEQLKHLDQLPPPLRPLARTRRALLLRRLRGGRGMR